MAGEAKNAPRYSVAVGKPQTFLSPAGPHSPLAQRATLMPGRSRSTIFFPVFSIDTRPVYPPSPVTAIGLWKWFTARRPPQDLAWLMFWKPSSHIPAFTFQLRSGNVALGESLGVSAPKPSAALPPCWLKGTPFAGYLRPSLMKSTAFR